MMSSSEPSDDIIETVLHFFVREVQDPLKDRIRSRLLLIEALVPRDEKPGHHS
jgi:hypothetical protein